MSQEQWYSNTITVGPTHPDTTHTYHEELEFEELGSVGVAVGGLEVGGAGVLQSVAVGGSTLEPQSLASACGLYRWK